MKSVQVLAVLVSIVAAARCFPFSQTDEAENDPIAAVPSHLEASDDETSNSTSESATEDDGLDISMFGFQTPLALQLVSSDGSNATEDDGVGGRSDSGATDPSTLGDDADDEYDEEESDDGSTSVIEVSKKVVYKLEVLNEESLNKSSSVTNIFGDKIKGLENKNNETAGGSNSSDSSLRPSIIFTETLISDTDITGDPSVIGEKDQEAVEAFYSSGTPAFAKEPGLSDIIKENLGSKMKTKNEKSANGTEDQADQSSSADSDSTLRTSNTTSEVQDPSIVTSSGDESSVHRRAAPEYDSDDTEFENTTDVSVVASVSSSAGNYNRKIYESVDTDGNGGSFSSSPNVDYDPAPQYFASEPVFGPETPAVVDQQSLLSSPDSEEVESTTPAPYDEEAALVQRQRLAELRRKFLEDEAKENVDKTGEEGEEGEEEEDSALDYSGDSETEKPVLSLLPDAHRAIFY